MYRVLYLICLKTKALCPKKKKKNRKKNLKKRKAFFFHLLLKWPGVNAASVLDDYLLG